MRTEGFSSSTPLNLCVLSVLPRIGAAVLQELNETTCHTYHFIA